jgi:hypothetical protein
MIALTGCESKTTTRSTGAARPLPPTESGGPINHTTSPYTPPMTTPTIPSLPSTTHPGTSRTTGHTGR